MSNNSRRDSLETMLAWSLFAVGFNVALVGCVVVFGTGMAMILAGIAIMVLAILF